MLPVHDRSVSVRTSRLDVDVADGYLAAVLRGEAFLVFDGAMGTMLQAAGLQAGELPELLCLADPAAVTAVHRAYVEAGAQAVTTNTFGANARKLAGACAVDEVFAAAVRCARDAGARYVAGDIGPTGALLAPLGTMAFDEAYGLFAEQVAAATAAGADLIVIETMADLLEMKAAVLAAKENCRLPVFATMTFGEDGRTFLGTDPATAAYTLDALGVNVLGVNCSLGPAQLRPIVDELLAASGCPVMVQANAGLPEVVGGDTVYSVAPDEYAREVCAMVDAGVSVVGGCCGTTPAYIRRLADYVAARTPTPRAAAHACTVTSAQRSVRLAGDRIATIGERINPTGKKRLKEALRTRDTDYILAEAVRQTQAGCDVLDVNAGLPEIDEPAVLSELVGQIQGVSPLPLQIDSSDPRAVEAAVRVYAGKPLINSVNGAAESLAAVLPVAKHYGCAVVGLTLDEGGIPPTAHERLEIARRIVEEAAAYGIPREDVFVDCLVMSAATNQAQVREILRAVTLVKDELSVRTVLGVSNVSFGLPVRPVVNATFLAAAFSAGLDMPILNPLDPRYREVVDTWRVLNGQDAGAARFIEGYADKAVEHAAAAPAAGKRTDAGTEDAGDVRSLVVAGRKADVADGVRALLAELDALAVIDRHLIPALDEVGEKFERGSFFLPQLMASAEAAKAGFDVIKEQAAAGDAPAPLAEKGPVVVATVKGDIHDIGKNIVKMLMENYGYAVIDLGRDVEPQAVLDAVVAHDAKLVGLSALMTTTVAGMEETIGLLHERAPETKVMVGGAVLNPEYAEMVGADYYAKDAAAAVRIASGLFG